MGSVYVSLLLDVSYPSNHYAVFFPWSRIWKNIYGSPRTEKKKNLCYPLGSCFSAWHIWEIWANHLGAKSFYKHFMTCWISLPHPSSPFNKYLLNSKVYSEWVQNKELCWNLKEMNMLRVDPVLDLCKSPLFKHSRREFASVRCKVETLIRKHIFWIMFYQLNVWWICCWQ